MMRLNCVLEISDRNLPSKCSRTKRKSFHGLLAVGMKPGADKTLAILVSSAKNKSGTTYKVSENVNKLFDRFVEEGKATIRFVHPPHDLLISKADSVQLKGFLKVVRLALNDPSCKLACFTTLTPPTAAQLKPPVTSLEIECREVFVKRYHLKSQAFPTTLTKLRISNCQLQRIQQPLLVRLQALRSLDFSNNRIVELPEQMGLLNLQELRLAQNQLTYISAEIFNQNLGSSLQLLDVSNNNIAKLPNSLCLATNMHTLMVQNNVLVNLPPNLGNLKRLKFLTVSNNKIPILPGTIIMLRLQSIDLHGNPFRMEPVSLGNEDEFGCPPLVEIASRCVLKLGLQIQKGDIPLSLIAYLSNFQRCYCGKLFVKSPIAAQGALDIRCISETVTLPSAVPHAVPILRVLCSYACKSKYAKGGLKNA